MTTKRIIATIITFLVGVAALGFSYMIFKNVSELITSPSEEAIDTTLTAPPQSKTIPTTPLRNIKVKPIKNQRLQSGISAQGRLRAYDKVDLVAEIPGMMRPKIKPFKIGTRYKKGETIFEVDNEEAKLNLQAQKAQLQTVLTQMMPDLKIDMPSGFEHWKKYLDNFNVNQTLRPFPKPSSEQEAYYVSLKGIHSQYYTIKSGELRLTKYNVTAPFDGIITQAFVGDSGYLRAGAPLGTIMNTSAYELEAAIPVADLKSIRIGRSVKVVSDDSNKSWSGTVVRIGDIIEPTTQMATVYITLNGQDLREGQYLRAIINHSTSKQASTIDNDLIVDGNKVYVVQDSVVILIPIQVIKIEGNNAVVKGLKDNALLITDQSRSLKEGEKIIPIN